MKTAIRVPYAAAHRRLGRKARLSKTNLRIHTGADNIYRKWQARTGNGSLGSFVSSQVASAYNIVIMSCLPQSGGCERPFTDLFVAHLNRAEGMQYKHRACLDVMDSSTPQPEALYADEGRGLQLVIERKSISWPADYAYRHSNDHAVGDVFAHELRDLTLDDLYEIRLPMLMEGKRASLLALAGQATREIRDNWAVVSSGRGLRGRVSDKWWWQFHRVPSEEREENAPDKGLRISLEEPWSSSFEFLDPASLPEPLTSAIRKIYASCSGKFASYQDQRRILLLDPQEDLRMESAKWWHEVWTRLPPPLQIGEIWSGVLDWVDDETKEWTFERLYVTSVT